MAREYRIVRAQGDRQLAEAIANGEDQGFELFQILWTGNISPSQPVGILNPHGEGTKVGIVHLYLIIFAREDQKNKKKFPRGVN